MNERLDVALVNRGLIDSREKARAVIMSGIVYLNNQKADKPGQNTNNNDIIEIRGETLKYVSRGGLKLEKAIDSFKIKLDGCTCMDIGASTGGFTDCMLQNGAVKVYAIDVGYGQLAWKLRSDDRVVNLERTNIRYVTEDQIPEKIGFASVDVSFISLRLVLPVAYKLLEDNGRAVCLVKPQFEAGRELVGKKGVVKEQSTHLLVLQNAVSFAAEIGFDVLDLDFSPIKGPEGNIEYLMFLQKGSGSIMIEEDLPDRVVSASHNKL